MHKIAKCRNFTPTQPQYPYVDRKRAELASLNDNNNNKSTLTERKIKNGKFK